MSGQQERKRDCRYLASHDDANLVTIIALPLGA